MASHPANQLLGDCGISEIVTSVNHPSQIHKLDRTDLHCYNGPDKKDGLKLPKRQWRKGANSRAISMEKHCLCAGLPGSRGPSSATQAAGAVSNHVIILKEDQL